MKAYRTRPWPFSQLPLVGDRNVVGGHRFFPGFPLAQDVLGQVMAVVCDWHCEDVNGPEPVFGRTLEKQLDALACDYVYTTPDTHPERVEWCESVRRVFPTMTELAAAGVQGLAWEVARLVSPATGAVRVETIDTWLRATVEARTVELSTLPSSALLAVGGPEGSPFAMPQVFGAFTLAWEWALVHSRFGWIGDAPLWLTAAPPAMIPAGGDLLARWTDNRYAWGSPRQRASQFQAGQHGLVRLICTLRGSGTFPTTPSSFALAGSLTGFHQQAGRRAAAVDNITHRRH